MGLDGSTGRLVKNSTAVVTRACRRRGRAATAAASSSRSGTNRVKMPPWGTTRGGAEAHRDGAGHRRAGDAARGSTRSGSLAANGMAPSVMNESPSDLRRLAGLVLLGRPAVREQRRSPAPGRAAGSCRRPSRPPSVRAGDAARRPDRRRTCRRPCSAGRPCRTPSSPRGSGRARRRCCPACPRSQSVSWSCSQEIGSPIT